MVRIGTEARARSQKKTPLDAVLEEAGQAPRVDPIDDRQVLEKLRRTVVFEAHFELNGRFYSVGFEIAEAIQRSFYR